MDFKKQLPMAFGVLAPAVGGFGVPAQAAEAHCASEECACKQALQQNMVEALEEFLRKNPQGGGCTCILLAAPLSEERPDFDSQDKDTDDTTGQSDAGPAEG